MLTSQRNAVRELVSSVFKKGSKLVWDSEDPSTLFTFADQLVAAVSQFTDAVRRASVCGVHVTACLPDVDIFDDDDEEEEEDEDHIFLLLSLSLFQSRCAVMAAAVPGCDCAV